MLKGGVSYQHTSAPPIFSAASLFGHDRPQKISSSRACDSRSKKPSQIQPFVHFAPLNSSGINTSEKFSISRISLICHAFNFTRINTSGDKDLKSPGINTSGSKDLKSLRINTSKKHGRGEGAPPICERPEKNFARDRAIHLTGAF
jgi:hypothetical protein